MALGTAETIAKAEWEALEAAGEDLAKWATPLRRENGKVPALKGWQDLPPATGEQRAEWARKGYGIGIRTGHEGLVAIDCDIDDAGRSDAVRECLARALGPSFSRFSVRERGSPRWATFVRISGVSGDFEGLVKCFLPFGGPAGGKVEVLALGQQLAVFGLHPEGKRYSWTGGRPEAYELSLEAFEALKRELSELPNAGEWHGGGKPRKKGGGGKKGKNTGDELAEWLRERGSVKSEQPDGRLNVVCPWEAEHTGETGESSTVYFPKGSGGEDAPGFKCLHAHCAGRDYGAFLAWARSEGFELSLEYPDESGGRWPEPFIEFEGWVGRVRWLKIGSRFERIVKAPFEVLGVFQTGGAGASYWLKGKQRNGQPREWRVRIGQRPDEVYRQLADECAPLGAWKGVEQALFELLNVASFGRPNGEAVSKTGWVTPEGWQAGDALEPVFCFMPDGERVSAEENGGALFPVFEPAFGKALPKGVKGTLEDWKREVAPLLARQTKGLLMLSGATYAAVCRLVPNASPLTLLLTGESSSGKTTWLRAMESFDGPRAEKGANSTAKALEVRCKKSRDFVVSLDEFTVTDPRAASDIAYAMNGNSRDGLRLDRATGEFVGRDCERFFPVCFGTSETSLASKMLEADRRVTGGQAARVLCPDADAGHGFKAFSTLDALEEWQALSDEERRTADKVAWGRRFAERVGAAVGRCYGAPARAWRAWLVAHFGEVGSRMEERREAFEAALNAALMARPSGERRFSEVGGRVSVAFGWLCASLDLANEALGLGLGAPEELRAAFVSECLAYADANRFFDGSQERVSYRERLSAFLFENVGKFQELRFCTGGEEDFEGDVPRERLGYLDKRGDVWRFLVLPEVFRTKLTLGFEPEVALNALRETGALDAEPGRRAKKIRVGRARDRFVCIRASQVGGLWTPDEDAPPSEGEETHSLPLMH